MPKTNFCKPKPDGRPGYVLEVILGGMARNGLKTKDLAVKSGMNASTLFKRRAHPETFTLKELWAVLDVLEPDEGFEKKILTKGADRRG